MKRITILMLCIFTLSSCSNDDPIPNQIVGEWKLMKAKFSGLQGGNSSVDSIDYTNKNIIYNFRTNNTLIVSGGKNVGYPNGTYNYFFGKDHLGGNSDPKILLIKVNNSKWTYNLTNGKMTLGNSYVDGPDLVFERK